ncbi:hypothetical protein C8J57DRAFT_1720680, partial [Mycena rebaudengoi]
MTLAGAAAAPWSRRIHRHLAHREVFHPITCLYSHSRVHVGSLHLPITTVGTTTPRLHRTYPAHPLALLPSASQTTARGRCSQRTPSFSRAARCCSPCFTIPPSPPSPRCALHAPPPVPRRQTSHIVLTPPMTCPTQRSHTRRLRVPSSTTTLLMIDLTYTYHTNDYRTRCSYIVQLIHRSCSV